MSLPVNSEYLSLERIARYRYACSNGSPCAMNNPIDIKPRGKRGYEQSGQGTDLFVSFAWFSSSSQNFSCKVFCHLFLLGVNLSSF